jgi:hypothetical protein
VNRDVHGLESAEQRRWVIWLGPPFAIQAVSLGLVFATGREWFLALGLGSIFVIVVLLIRLILKSDTNMLLDDTTADVIELHLTERPDPVAAAVGTIGAPR